MLTHFLNYDKGAIFKMYDHSYAQKLMLMVRLLLLSFTEHWFRLKIGVHLIICEYITETLRYLFNNSIDNGMYSSAFKSFKTPFYKKEEESRVNNYRPI